MDVHLLQEKQLDLWSTRQEIKKRSNLHSHQLIGWRQEQKQMKIDRPPRVMLFVLFVVGREFTGKPWVL